MILGCLGPLPFISGKGSLFAPHSIAKTHKSSWARHKIMGANDVLEDTGLEPIDLTVEMTFFAPWTFSPASSLNQLEAFAEAKVPVPVLLGNTPLGRGLLSLYVVDAIDSKMEKWVGNRLTILHVTVKLVEFSLPASPLTGFLSNPVGTLAGAASGAVTGGAARVISSIGLPGPVSMAASKLALGSAPNILAAPLQSVSLGKLPGG